MPLITGYARASESAPDRFGAVRICYEYNAQPPYTFGDNITPINDPGLLVELIQQVFTELPYEASFYRRSWKRCMEDLKSGQADATFAMIWTAARGRWAQFPSNPDGQLDHERYLWTGTYKIFVNPDSRLGWDGKRLSNLNFGIGAPLGYISYQRLDELNALSQMNVDPKTGLELAARHRIDGYVIDQAIGTYHIQMLGLQEDLTSLDIPFMTSYWYLPFSKSYYQRHPERVEQVWETLERVRRKEKNSLLKKYLQ